MKKKRSDKKNGSSSNLGANGSDAANGFPNDKHHNRSIPCSNSAAVIAQEIFPTVAQPLANVAGNDGADADGKVAENGGKKNNAAGKKSKEEKSTTDENGSSTKKEEQPLLGFMIQSYLVEERKNARAEQGIGNNGNSGSSSKKKKNKKKRKKKAAATPSTEGAEVQRETNIGGDLGGENDCKAAGASSSSGKENSLNNVESSSESVANKSLKLSSCLPSLESTVNPPPSPQNGGKEKNTSSGLDRLLDSLIDSKEASCTIGSDASKRGGRDLEAFSAFLTRKLESHSEQLPQSQQKKDKSKAASSSLGSDQNEAGSGMEFKDILPTISINDAHDLSNAADCRKCRTSATSHLRNLIREEPFLFAADGNIEIEHQPTIKHPIIILNEESAKIHPLSDKGGSNTKGDGYSLAIPISGLFTNGIENAFDYRSMDDVDLEAGGHQENEKESSTEITTPSSFHLELRPISQASEKFRFLQMGTVSERSNGGGSVVQEYPMNTQDIINLVKCVLLPCGLEQSSVGGKDVSDTPDLDDPGEKELADIAKIAFDSLGRIQSDLLQAKMSIFGMKEDMEKAENTNNRSYFDAKTTRILNDCDTGCELLLKQLGGLVLRLFKSVCLVGWSSEYGLSLLEFVLNLWNRYHETFIHLVEPVMKHRGNILRAAAREGLVPQAYTNKLARGSLEELVRTKMSTLNALVEDLTTITKGRSNAPSPMVRLFLLEAYRQHVEPKVTADNVFPDQEGEELFMQLIAAQIDLSQKTINCGLLEGVKKKAEEHRVEMTSLSRKVRTMIIAMEDLAPETKVKFLRTAYRNFESTWYDLEKLQKELKKTTPSDIDGGEIGYEIKDMSLLLQRSGILVSQWIILLCSRQCHESSMKSLSFPPRLKTWLDSISGTEMPKSMPGDQNIKQQCDGDGGERRVSSILAALLYRWLEARCSEWHAELTRDELLQSMDMEEPIGNKSGKKKKSKRKSGNKGKNNKDDKNDSQAQETPSGIDNKKPVVDESSTNTTPVGDKYQDLEITQDEKKDDLVEVCVNGESSTAKAESIIHAESLITIKEIRTEGGTEKSTAAMVLVGELKEQKPKRKAGGDNRGQTKEDKNHSRNAVKKSSSSKKSEVSENPAVTVAQVSKEDVTVEADAHDESQTRDNDDSNGIDAEVVTAKDPEKENTLPTKGADELSSVQPPQKEEGLENMKCEYRPSVGIIDGKQVVTAEMYLVKRLQAIVGLKRTDSTPSTKKVPIIWM